MPSKRRPRTTDPLRRIALSLASILALACTNEEDPTVILHPKGKSPVEVRVEVADTPQTRSIGLMYRSTLPENQGMLFLFEDDRDHGFWMKNTSLPLDMIFISKQGEIVGIQADTKPFSLELRRVGTPSRVVLEMPAGFAARHGLEPGDRVTYRGIGSERLP